MKRKQCFVLRMVMLLSVCVFGQMPKYKDVNQSIEERVEDLLSRMTLEEKIEFMSGMRSGGHRKGTWDGTTGNKRLGIQPFRIYHGPYGINPRHYAKTKGTYYPATINMGTTWNPDLVQKSQVSLGKELTAAGGQSNAGPAMNIIRDLRGGRSSEYFTEDPYLNGKMGAAFVKGIQSQGHLAIMKHYVCNNQERDRNTINVKVGERALREIYLPGFKTAVKEANVLGVMTGYNSVNGYTTCDNKHIIKDILKDEWGFKGVVMTDWAGSGKTVTSMVKAGLDFEMPRPSVFKKEKVLKAVENGNITEVEIDNMLRRVLYVTFYTGVMDKAVKIDEDGIASKESVAVAREVAEESFVLLKNEGDLLPIYRNKVKRVAVIGPNGDFGMHFRNGNKSYQLLQGGGSASIVPPTYKMITPFKGIKNQAGESVEVIYEPGCFAEHGTTVIETEFLKTKDGKEGLDALYFANNDLKGKGVKKVDKKVSFTWHKTPEIIEQGNTNQGGSNKEFSARWIGSLIAPKSRMYVFELEVRGVAKLYIDGKMVVNKNRPFQSDCYAMSSIFLEKGKHDIKVEYQKSTRRNQLKLLWDYGNDAYLEKAIALAKTADVVIMPVGTSGNEERESVDRDNKLNKKESLTLSTTQEDLIKEIAKVNKNVVVVTFTVGVVMEAWKNDVSSIIYGGFPGQEGGNALGSIVFGDINPSGKLTVSIPESIDQFPKDFYSYTNEIKYKEGIYVGYRYFDKHNLSPAYAFGHGLSYTQFSYGKVIVSNKVKYGAPVEVKVAVTNTGKIKGKEVVQLYVNDPESSEHRPLKELKAFKKVTLNPGETKVVSFVLNKDAFSFFSEKENQWKLEAGKFNIWIGASSQDIRTKGVVVVK